MSTKTSFENELKQLGIVFESEDHTHFMNAIFINKQITQSDIRTLKNKYPKYHVEFKNLISKYKREGDLADLIVVSNEDAIPYQ